MEDDAWLKDIVSEDAWVAYKNGIPSVRELSSLKENDEGICLDVEVKKVKNRMGFRDGEFRKYIISDGKESLELIAFNKQMEKLSNIRVGDRLRIWNCSYREGVVRLSSLSRVEIVERAKLVRVEDVVEGKLINVIGKLKHANGREFLNGGDREIAIEGRTGAEDGSVVALFGVQLMDGKIRIDDGTQVFAKRS
ncbi:MAG: hypothetical protein D6797_09310 [Bdellovibrio sp.]|nr:MAG: hypothetical protein D6797_09310 [Bdellovibrio sp.]